MAQRDALAKAQTFAGLVTARFSPKHIFLFAGTPGGSYTKGNYHADSDIDIAVVFDYYADGLEMQLELMRLRRTVDSRIEPHPFRSQDFTITNPMVYEIMNYGQEIGNVA